MLFSILFLAMGRIHISAKDVTPTLSANTLTINVYGLTKSENLFHPVNNSIEILNKKEDSIVTVSSSKYLEVRESGNTYSFYPKRKGSYEVVFEIDGTKQICKVNVVYAFFSRNKKSLADDDSKTWVQDKTMLALYKGESETLKVKGMPSKVRWSSSDSTIVKVSGTGKIIAKEYGYATITAKSEGVELTYEVGVSYEKAVKALRYAVRNYHSTYSQEKRTQKGYYDCSSYVWYSYHSQGVNLGSSDYPPTAANIAKWCKQNGYIIMEGNIEISKLLPGDLIFETGSDNGRYRGIYHVDLYQGNGASMTVGRQKFYEKRIRKVMIARPSCVTPQKVAVASDALSLQISWKGCFGASGYLVYRSENEKGTYKKIGNAKGKTTYYDTDAQYKIKYFYKILPYWSSRIVYYGMSSKQGNGIRQKVSPAFTISNIYGGIVVHWDRVAGATGYRILRKNDEGIWRPIATVSSGKTISYLDTTAKSNKKYTYSIYAIKDGEKSAYNKEGASLVYIASPEIKSLSCTDTGMKISWNTVPGAKKYQLYRKLPSGKLRILTTTKKTSFVDKSVKNMGLYTYIVRCVSKDGEKMISGYNKNGATEIYVKPETQ